MKVEFDTKNWFQNKVLTAIIAVGVVAVINMIMLICVLCNLHHSSYVQDDGAALQHSYKAVIRY